LCGLSVVGIPFMTVMGLAAAATVGMAVLIALTLLPALLGFAGTKVISTRIPFVRRRPDFDSEDDANPINMGTRWAQFVTKRKAPVFIGAIVTLGVIAIPFTGMRTSLPDDGTAAKDTSQRQAYDLLTEAFGPGFNGPLLVALTNQAAADFASAADGITAQLKGLADVATVTAPVLNRAGDAATLTVVPASGPTSPRTQALVRAIRGLESADLSADRLRLYVTGSTAMQIDVTDKLNAALPTYLVVVVGLALVLLALVFRSIMVPIKAAAGFLLTIGATFGALVAIFQWGWAAGAFGVSSASPIVSFLPIIIIAILFGLAMDYEVFLVSRMREEFVHGAGPTDAVVGGFRHGARVVTAAAIIMISVFSGFMLGNNAIIKSVGFSLAFGVAVDAFVVRMTIVPAFLAIVGRSAWWLPRGLDRVMPNVDVEGAKLLNRLGADGADEAARPDPAGGATDPEGPDDEAQPQELSRV
ncbi:MAG: MMPL family transporter, partial [Frankiaceae bacterium]|nr:MMPL family transporter [Frankiaceae bacterium]